MKNIHLVGAPGLDGVAPNSARRDKKLILVTYHPETMAEDHGVAGCLAMVEVLRTMKAEYEIIISGVNNDPGADKIRSTLCEVFGIDPDRPWDQCHGPGVQYVRNQIDHSRYIELMQEAALVIGNSSAGVIEAPWVGVPSVNIGYRQQGREFASSVYRVGVDGADLDRVIKLAMGHPASNWSPIYRGGAAPEIARVCREFIA